MTELFPDISDEIRIAAKTAWDVVKAQKDPADAVEFMDKTIKYFEETLGEEEADFLRFYFQVQMEMMKNESNDSSIG